MLGRQKQETYNLDSQNPIAKNWRLSEPGSPAHLSTAHLSLSAFVRVLQRNGINGMELR